MFNRLIKELIIDVNVPLRLAVRGMFVYCDIFDQFQTHLTGKLLNISILFDTLNELVYIFGILLFSIEPCCQLCLFLLQCFQFSLILTEQDTAGSLRDLTEVLVLIHGLDQTLQLRDTLLITKKPENKFVQDAIDRGNMKIASFAKNIIAKYDIAPENLRAEVTALFARSAALAGEVSSIKSQIESVEFECEVISEYKKLKPIYDEYSSLKGRKQEKYQQEHFGKLTDFNSAKRDILEMYPDGHIPSAEAIKRRLSDLKQQLKEKSAEHTAAHQAYKELFQAQRDIEAYLRQYEPQVQLQSREQQKRKKDMLE